MVVSAYEIKCSENFGSFELCIDLINVWQGVQGEFPFALLSALTILGCSALIAWNQLHILLLGASPGADFLGTITIRLAHGLMLWVIIPAHFKLSICCCTQL